MKNFILICTILFFLSFHIVHWNDIKDRLNLIKNYTYNLKEEINILLNKYNINKDKIEKQLWEINDMLNIIENINNKEYNENEYNQIIELILKEIKENKNEIKNIVIKEQEEYKKSLLAKKKTYSKLWIKLNTQFDTIIKKYYNIYQKKENITKTDTQIIKILKNLSTESLKLKNFWLLNFDSIEEMNNTFTEILKNIKKEMITLKSLK